jgi:hypothetical protein
LLAGLMQLLDVCDLKARQVCDFDQDAPLQRAAD